jgi:hypothetical protein
LQEIESIFSDFGYGWLAGRSFSMHFFVLQDPFVFVGEHRSETVGIAFETINISIATITSSDANDEKSGKTIKTPSRIIPEKCQIATMKISSFKIRISQGTISARSSWDWWPNQCSRLQIEIGPLFRLEINAPLFDHFATPHRALKSPGSSQKWSSPLGGCRTPDPLHSSPRKKQPSKHRISPPSFDDRSPSRPH